MEYKAFMIKYAEIGTKGKNRYVFEDVLCNRIKEHVDGLGSFVIRREYGRIFLEAESDFDYEDVVDELKKVFGIVGICPIVVEDSVDFESIKTKCLEYMGKRYGDKEMTFKVYARRADKTFPMQSMEVNSEIGHYLLEEFPQYKVDVHNPDVMLTIEIREKGYQGCRRTSCRN